MKEGISYTGVPTAEELANCKGIPSNERMANGPVAVVECVQCIPCNPCESACPFGAISVGSPITNAPALDSAKCTGCGTCVAKCPGLAITVIDISRTDGKATLAFPWEYLPVPAVGDTVTAVDRTGSAICSATVLAVSTPSNNATAVIKIEFDAEYAARVKSIVRAKEGA